MKFYLEPALFVLLPGLAAAQGLDDFLAASLSRSVDARQAVETRAQVEQIAAQSWGGLLPALTATGGFTRNDVPAQLALPASFGGTAQTIVISPSNQLDATVRAEVPIIDVNRWARTSAASAQVDAAVARESEAAQQLKRTVVSVFYNAVGARAVLESARKSLAVAQAELLVSRDRLAAGVGGELDLERAKAEVERNRQLVAEADAQAEVSQRSLESTSGLPVSAALEPPPPDDLHAEAPLGELEARADAVAPVAAAVADHAAAARTTRSAYFALVPSVKAFAQERLTNATGFSHRNDLFTAGVTFDWRLDLVGVQAIGAQQHAEALAALSAERARLNARDQIHSDWQKVRSAIERARASQAQVEATARAAQLAHERFAAGVVNQVDVIQADRDVFAAEVARTQSQLELAFDRQALRLSAGLPLEARR